MLGSFQVSSIAYSIMNAKQYHVRIKQSSQIDEIDPSILPLTTTMGIHFTSSNNVKVDIKHLALVIIDKFYFVNNLVFDLTDLQFEWMPR